MPGWARLQYPSMSVRARGWVTFRVGHRMHQNVRELGLGQILEGLVGSLLWDCSSCQLV